MKGYQGDRKELGRRAEREGEEGQGLGQEDILSALVLCDNIPSPLMASP